LLSRRCFLKAGGGAALAFLLSKLRLSSELTTGGKMAKRRLGRTGLEVSVIGFGGAPLRRVREAEALLEAFKLGVNFVDTAANYGKGASERVVGEALRRYGGRVYVATKTAKRRAAKARADVEGSLRRLGVPAIDIIQLHSVSSPSTLKLVMGANGALKAVKELRDSGLVRFIGITGGHGALDLRVRVDPVAEAKTIALAILSGEFDVVQVSYNILYMGTAIEKVLDLAEENDVGVIVKKPFVGGRMLKWLKPRELLKPLLEDKRIHTVIPGMKTVEHVRENVPVGYVQPTA